MNNNSLKGQKFRLRDRIIGELEETLYTVIAEEPDYDIPGLVWIYLESEYGDENIEYEPKFDIYYAKMVANTENLLV